MANINDQRNQLRSDLLKAADTIAALRSKAAINDVNALKEMSHAAAELHRKAHALEHLLETEPEKVKVEVHVPAVQPEIQKQEPPKAEVTPVTRPAPQVKTLPDLRTMIGLNEKLMFIRSLFSGDSNLYDIDIGKFNSCHTKPETEALLDEMTVQRHWKKDSEAFLSLESILKRRNSQLK